MIAGDPTSLDERQVGILAIAERITSVISLLGLAFIFTTFIWSEKFRKPINRLMFLAAFGDAIYNIGTLIARAGIDAGTGSPLCQFQAFVIEMFLLSDLMWCLAMALNVWLTVFKKFDASRLRSLEWAYAIINYGVPFIVALTLLFVETERRGKTYGDAFLWCWISLEWDYLRIVVLYGPAWVLILAIATIYVLAGREIFNKRRKLEDFSSTNASQRRSKAPDVSFKTTEVHVSTELADMASPTPPLDNIASHDPEGARQKMPYSQYDVTIGPGDVPLDVSNTTNPVQHLTKPQRRALSERNNAAWAYTKCAMLFFMALLITWLPSSINRVYSLIYPDRTNWGLNLAAAIVLPLMGFWNTIIYIFTSWRAVKSLFQGLGQTRAHRSATVAASHVRRPPSPPWTMIGRGRSKTNCDSSDENLPAVHFKRNSRSNITLEA